jgi:hypothetical protein
MAIWKTKFIDFDQHVVSTANLTLEDLGNGHASGTLRGLSGPVHVDELDLSGVVRGNEFVVGGSNQALGINLFLIFAPFTFAFAGSARLVVHAGGAVSNLFVITSGID